MAGNRNGKSHCGAFEMSSHLTGFYPEWWEGRTFNYPIRAWACGVSNETTRDILQRKLFGKFGEWGTGLIPKDTIIGKPVMARGVPGMIDYCEVRHSSGGKSFLSLKTYQQGVEKFMGDDLDVIWLDEEPPESIFTECEARTVDRQGIIYVTFTPLQGITGVVSRFYPAPDQADRGLVRMEIEDALHISAEERESIVSRYSPHEREARAKGIPMLGSGRVFDVEESTIVTKPFEVPSIWAQIGGLDFGIDHPTAAVLLAHDRDSDIVYLIRTYRQSDARIALHADALRRWGDWIPWAWPHDGYWRDRSSGFTTAQTYRDKGLRMLPKHATNPKGGFGREDAIAAIHDRMVTGRFKVFETCQDWLDEFRMFHRKDGAIVKKRDDLMDATMKAVMMLRKARVRRPPVRPQIIGMDYDPTRPEGI